jgi:hypothetical protein
MEEDAVGKVSCIAIQGLDLWFNSQDHLPFHFHVKKTGCWEVRVFFLECGPGHLECVLRWAKKGSGPTAVERQRILTAVLDHRAELLDEWDRKVRLEGSK